MNICNIPAATSQYYKFIPGHLYKWNNRNSKVYIATDDKQIITLETGESFSSEGRDPSFIQDVTDQYCLQKIK
jgi:hypothetical protein